MNHAFSSISVSLLAAGLLLSIAPLSGETVLQTASATSDQSWETTTLWSNTAAPSAGNDYLTNGYTLRTPDGAGLSKTFPGASLTVDGGAGGTRGQLMLKAGTTGIADLRLGVGTVRNAVASGSTNQPATLNVTNLTLLSSATGANAAILYGTWSGNDITLNVTNLLGSGHLQFAKTPQSDNSKRLFTLSVTDASVFTGILELQHGTVALASALNLISGSFIMATTNTTLQLNSSLTVSSFTFGSLDLEVGSYTSSQLNSHFKTSAFTGTGQLTVQAIPESSALAWMLGGITLTACVGFRCGRRR